MWDNENQIRQKQELELKINSCIYTMTSNVLPSAPPEETHAMYPHLPHYETQHDFRMQKANEVSADLNKEVEKYRALAKKSKRAKKATNWVAAGSGFISSACSVFELRNCSYCCGHSCCNFARRH